METLSSTDIKVLLQTFERIAIALEEHTERLERIEAELSQIRTYLH